jgi:hypothetical protein
MGKAKKRNFHNCIKTGGATNSLPPAFSREDAIKTIISKIKNNQIDNETKSIITLFGISAEELAEAGAPYEALIALKPIFIL